jgi:uncharacterized protein
MLDPVLKQIVVCPACRGSLSERNHGGTSSDAPRTELVCADCGRGYPVRDGIPVLLVDHARQV